jgi:hypothetical protein
MSEVKVNKITPTANCGTVTLGDSGDTFTIPSGVTLSSAGSITNSGTITNTGTISGGTITGTIDNQVNWDTTAKTTGFTAVAGNGYFVNTTSGAITVTLPATPTAGDLVGIKDYANTADTNNITIDRNGSNIQGVANNYVISIEGLAITLIYVDSTQGWVSTGAARASDIVAPQFVTATGGTITTCGNYKIHTFTGPGTFCVSCSGNACGSSTVDYLVVAGGGGGAAPDGGAGGAGGYRESSGTASGCYSVSPLGTFVPALPVSVTGYPITVGAGGNGGNPGSNGSNSIFSTITSSGGGKGGNYQTSGSAGGSGGGAGRDGSSPSTGNTPPVSPPQGQPGGGSNPPSYGVQDWNGSGGGGGAGAAGGDGVGNGSSGPAEFGGNGGNGVSSSITGSSVARAGGGGGASQSNLPAGLGSGGLGGGGNGGNCNTAQSGTANTGGGGGGAPNTTAGSGGSGVVIIRYKYQ